MPFKFTSDKPPEDTITVVVKLSGARRRFIETGGSHQKISKAAAVIQCIDYAMDDHIDEEDPEPREEPRPPKQRGRPARHALRGDEEEQFGAEMIEPEFDEED